MATRGYDEARPLGRNLTHGLLDSLGRQIVRGDFEAAGFPTEAELARLHQVSRSVTREAVKMLTAKGLLSARPRQGTHRSAGRDVEPVRPRRAGMADGAAAFGRPAAPLQRTADRDRARGGGARGTLRHGRRPRSDRRRLGPDGGRRGGRRRPAGGRHRLSRRGARARRRTRSTASSATSSRSALRTSIRVTNRVAGRTASLADHAAVRDAILARRRRMPRAVGDAGADRRRHRA